MKKKDIFIVAICMLVIAASLYIIFRGFAPKAPSTTSKTKETIEFTGEIDKEEIKKLKERKDYGSPPMDNIGRDNPFASL